MQKITQKGMQLLQPMMESIQKQKRELEHLEKSLPEQKKEKLNKLKQETLEMIKKLASF